VLLSRTGQRADAANRRGDTGAVVGVPFDGKGIDAKIQQ
jgi:hypothetical protein